jgi:hypothetical protein
VQIDIGTSPESQTRSLGARTQLAATGKIEPEPDARVTGQHADEGTAGELTKAEARLKTCSDLDRPNVAETVTHLRLRARHEGLI